MPMAAAVIPGSWRRRGSDAAGTPLPRHVVQLVDGGPVQESGIPMTWRIASVLSR